MSRWSDREAVQRQIDDNAEISEADNAKAIALRAENARRVAVANWRKTPVWA